MRIRSWMVVKAGEPMVLEDREDTPGAGEVLVKVAGCGVCHTDLGFYYEGVPTRHPLPLVLGHEIAGTVVEAGPGAERWKGRAVIVPAVIPCGSCDACLAEKGGVCPKQIFPGNDVHGGFATHVRVPAHGLCNVPDLRDPAGNPNGLDLAALSVIADAISTPFQAVIRSELADGDLAVVVGAGGVGGFAVQIAAAKGAAVVAVDTNRDRLQLMSRHGAALTLVPEGADPVKAVRAAVKAFAESRRIPTWRWKIFECSGAAAGQSLAFALLGHGGYLSLVGFTPAKVEVRLSNLMAFDATAQGNWGCLPDLYPHVLDLVLSGRVAVEPFLERRPLASINETFADLKAHKTTRRVVLIPEA
jgi:6-hydroxycyclohex-1-ene-1-carbonyl-CoA dehydrogenase